MDPEGAGSRTHFAQAKSSDVNAFVRRMIYNMDNCSGTNKSQYMFGCIALLTMLSILDVIHLWFQLQGHTKFKPDSAAQKTAGVFNSEDTFNHGMLNDHFRHHVRVTAYDERLLDDWHSVTPKIFDAIHHITQYRYFIFMRDDGQVDLGAPLAQETSDAAEYPDKGPVYSDAVIERESESLARRTLMTQVLPSVFRGQFEGVGSGSGDVGPATKRLIPRDAANVSISRVRLFKKMHCTSKHWVEQLCYMKSLTDVEINAIISSVKAIVPGQIEGPRLAHIKQQYREYVPPKFVPDDFDISLQGASGLVKKPKVQSLLFGTSVLPAATEASFTSPSSSSSSCSSTVSSTGQVRWNRTIHGPQLISILDEHYHGKYPRGFNARNEIAKMLNVKYESLRDNHKSVPNIVLE